MATIKKLKLKLMSGLLSEMQSDTIFGHFAWRFKEEHGEDELKKMLDLFLNKKPWFTVSDGFLEKNDEIYFPQPFKLTPMGLNNKSKKERIKFFLSQKASKSRSLISTKQLNYYLSNDIENYEKSILETAAVELPKFKNDLRVSVEIDRETFKTKKGKLFTENPKYLDENVSTAVFIKVLDKEKYEQFNCDDILKTVFNIGFGKKKSAGYGQFDVLAFDDFNDFKVPLDSNGFITLSHYLPANEDGIIDAYYEYNVKYGKLGEEKSKSQNPFKRAMILMKPGSCFLTDNKKDFYGKAINNLTDYNPNIVQNCIAFTLNCKF